MIEVLIAVVVMALVYFGTRYIQQPQETTSTDTPYNPVVDTVDAPISGDIPLISIPNGLNLPMAFTDNTIPNTAATPSNWNWKGPYDSLIYNYCQMYGLRPSLIKGLMFKESSFRPRATSYVFDKKTLKRVSTISSTDAMNAILSASDGGQSFLDSHGVDVSLGLMQLRTMTAQGYEPVMPVDLYDPDTNIRIACRHVSGMFSRGITEDTIDAYNMGEGNIKRGHRNLSYRDGVLSKAATYIQDFPA